ncbi:putative sulfate exporter family transporter [Corynebacterium sp. TAE3-ERU12]|uniref:YeiH family protein n=1 Tax=Corynebacterium sp. TAE3-ERU12 TaxID=2849491 RepID=UPI001C479562|nr:putative sulfate exporter family transporter [Corynebacterium sp. TAE3-ERU12]MBV7295035.1 putative sulfate exporter family transporter [Corynebacterium sp. TAE3-ERU12]
MEAAKIPGLGFCLAGAIIAWGIGLVFAHLGISIPSLLVAILLGIIVVNTTGVPTAAEPGIAVAAKQVLRIGVVLLGFAIPVGDIIGLGIGALVLVVAVVVAGLAAAVLIGRAMGLPREQSLLIGGGCSICGAAAVAGVDGVLSKRRAHEAATAVAVVVLYGTAMIAIAPILARLLGFGDEAAGIFIGGSVHEVAQVVAAGAAVSSAALTVAVVVKLARVLMLAPVLAVIGIQERRRGQADPSAATPPLVPLFVIGFIVAVALRSILPIPEAIIDASQQVRTWFFLVAMTALGTGVRRETLAAAGWRPFVHGGLVSVVVIVVAAVGSYLVTMG